MTDTRVTRASGAPEKPGSKPWQAYLDAELGFRNHWYPAFFSKRLVEDECFGQEMLGERILFKRINGKVHAMEDRCAHRGVKLSVRPECHSKNTISCWYHGFTYDFRDGKLINIVTDPECPLIGKVALKTYPVEERKNMVFIYIGDETPHALSLDLQPGFLDDDIVIYPNGEHGIVKSNWRLATENGIDASHIYIHRNAGLLNVTRKQVPLSSYFHTREGMWIDDEGGPKGIRKSRERTLIWDTEIEGVKISSQYGPDNSEAQRNPVETTMWLPCGAKVDPFPIPDVVQFEWYVPLDEHSHHYIVTWGRRSTSAAQTDAFVREFDTVWKELVVEHFNNDDVIAREAMESFYADEDGWQKEVLFRPDLVVIEWRKLAAKHNRGIQTRSKKSA